MHAAWRHAVWGGYAAAEPLRWGAASSHLNLALHQACPQKVLLTVQTLQGPLRQLQPQLGDLEQGQQKAVSTVEGTQLNLGMPGSPTHLQYGRLQLLLLANGRREICQQQLCCSCRSPVTVLACGCGWRSGEVGDSSISNIKQLVSTKAS
jgi:hypothetical protein